MVEDLSGSFFKFVRMITISLVIGEARSVYVGNLPSSISASDLEQVFKNFGRLRSDGVSIRSRKVNSIEARHTILTLLTWVGIFGSLVLFM